ncbi:hypothetical protein GSY74_03210 [Sulfurovum sp. bin170]|uniref:hypothetical protein n=1 Tax=Sulfurovum sp. bin170 TaxID=2695268 RepID=UPI0013E005F2|nr:hypothetical protein [Sulfurovum sp. bin170]NEW60282.1 hypothetical protein [Sulfurovum sp. bin170]
MNLDHLKKSMKLALRERFSSIKYGDDHRRPSVYISTHTDKAPFIGTLPKDIAMQSEKSYQEFPKLSKRLLVELFSGIGVEYVPEICIYQLKKSRPIEIFQDFVMSFGISVENRLEQIDILDADILNRVVFSLKRMDDLRREHIFDSRPIYKLLAQHEFEKAEKMIENLNS